MGPGSRSAWKVIAIAYLVLASSTAAYVVYEVTRPSTACSLSEVYSSTTGPWNVNYASENVSIPARGAGWGPVRNISFDDVQFELYANFDFYDQVAVQGTGEEPSDVDVAFLVLLNVSSGSSNFSTTPTNFSQWFSPDGVFGLTELSASNSSIEVQLSVAQPLLNYSYDNVTVPAAPAVGCVEFHGVSFALQWAGGGPLEPQSLVASATEPNGTIVGLSVGGAQPAACATPAPGLLGYATCSERGVPNQSAGLIWQSGDNVTLMVLDT